MPPSDRALATAAHPNIPFGQSASYRQQSQQKARGGNNNTVALALDEMSDSGESSASPSSNVVRGRCFCGRDVMGMEGGIYCSVACARSDAFSSLCYKPAATTSSIIGAPPSSFNYPQSSAMRETPSLASSISTSLSRNPSTTSNTSTSTSMSNASASDDWNASHYRRLARADIRREERKEERRRRRVDSTTSRSTTLSTASSRVPDLVGGGGHSRNVSVASTASSAYTVGSLSRNPSSASSASSRRYGGGVHVDTVIMEDDDEEEWLTGGSDSKPYAAPARKHHRRRGSNNGLSSGRLKQLEAFGMGKDMRDVLEEIIQMEKGFVLSDTEDHPEHTSPTPGLFTAQFDRPPRTPSPMAVDKRQSVIPAAPGAPARGHRVSLSHSHSTNHAKNTAPQRPPSMMGLHQSSLSESHTALYLATASPAAPGRRSASPKLQARKSLTFTPDKAGPSIGILRQHRFDSPMGAGAGATPSRRRGNISPNAQHPTMDHWRFPTSGSQSSMATPTRPPPINTTNLPGSFATPVSNRVMSRPTATATPRGRGISGEIISPQLLWPPSALPPPLAPALFPSSPATNGTPDYLGGGGPTLSPNSSQPPHSGLRLGVLLGSGEMDVDMDDDDSTAHGHGMETGGQAGYLPVFLEAEGFRTGYRYQ